MTRQEKANFIIKTLEQLFPDPEIPLKHKDAYTLLISVLLSAQCTDERVNKVTPALFAQADNPVEMAKLSQKKVELIIRTCGLAPRKSQAIVELSGILVKKYNGNVPQTFHELEELPGVGHKTASVVMSQAFHFPAFPVDTHIHRLAYRWGLSDGKNVEQTERDLKSIFDEQLWNKLHLQIIYYGRTYCPARGHDIQKCVICSKVGIKSRIL